MLLDSCTICILPGSLWIEKHILTDATLRLSETNCYQSHTRVWAQELRAEVLAWHTEEPGLRPQHQDSPPKMKAGTIAVWTILELFIVLSTLHSQDKLSKMQA